jgi:ribokinase
MSTSRITVIGSCSVDYSIKLDRLPEKGETVLNGQFVEAFGGKGANQAVAAAKAGGDVAFVGCVGDDHIGTQIHAALGGAGINTSSIVTEANVPSGVAIIMIGSAGINYLGVAPGANYRMTPAHVDAAEAVIAQSDLLIFQGELPMATTEYAIRKASAMSKRVIWNLAPALPIHTDVLRDVTCFVVNENEAASVCGYAVSHANAQDAARTLLALGPRVVIITLGGDGALIAMPDEISHVPAFKVNAIDTTAAGDVFCGAFAVALLEEKSLEDSARFASAASAISVTRLGAQSSVPSRDEIEAFLEANGHGSISRPAL